MRCLNCGCPLDVEATVHGRCRNCRAAVARAGRSTSSDGTILPVLDTAPGPTQPGGPHRALVGVGSGPRLAGATLGPRSVGRNGWEHGEEEASLLAIVLRELTE